MSQTQVSKATVYGPKGTLNVNESELAEWLTKGYSLDPSNAGKVASTAPAKIKLVGGDGDWKTSGAADGKPKSAWEKAGDIAYERAISEGVPESVAASIAVEAASAASKPGDPYFVGHKEVGLNGDTRAIKDDQSLPPVGRPANNETGKSADQKPDQPVTWLADEYAKLAKAGDEREPWQVAGDDAFKSAIDGGKSLKQASNAALKAAKQVDGHPFKD